MSFRVCPGSDKFTMGGRIPLYRNRSKYHENSYIYIFECLLFFCFCICIFLEHFYLNVLIFVADTHNMLSYEKCCSIYFWMFVSFFFAFVFAFSLEHFYLNVLIFEADTHNMLSYEKCCSIYFWMFVFLLLYLHFFKNISIWMYLFL